MWQNCRIFQAIYELPWQFISSQPNDPFLSSMNQAGGAHTHLNAQWIFTSKIHPRPHFLHFVQHMSNKGTKKSPVIRTSSQPTETRLDTKKFTILAFFFFFFPHQAISDRYLYLKNSGYLAEGLHLQPPLTAQGDRSGGQDSRRSGLLP